jgi:hypothetical protein
LLKLGYGNVSLAIPPGADDVLDSSGTMSVIDLLGSEPSSFSFFRLCEDLTGSPVSGSMGLDDFEDRDL